MSHESRVTSLKYEILKRSSLILSLIIILLTGLAMLMPASIEAQNATEVCEQIKKVDPAATCDPAGSQSAFSNTAKKIVGIMSYAVGVISIIVILVGAIMYGVSAGDPQKTKRAKDAILYAVIGIVVAVLGQAIVRFVISGVR